MTLRYVDWFCGAGGSTQGAARVPGVRPILAANHDQVAIDSHSAKYGNAVTPPVAEVLISALVECIQGHDIDWSAAA